MLDQAVAQVVALAPASFDRGQKAAPFGVAGRPFQAGRGVVLGVHSQEQGKKNAVSFGTGHEIHPLFLTRGNVHCRFSALIQLKTRWRPKAIALLVNRDLATFDRAGR